MKESVQNKKSGEMPFLDHIAELRKHLIKSIIGVVVGAIVIGITWSWVERLITAPLSSDFITFRLINNAGNAIGIGDIFEGPFDVQEKLTNLEFGGQFTAMIGVVLVGGLLVALPYVVYEVFQFLKPGLTSTERKYSNLMMLFTVFFFLLGVAFSYFLVLPLSIHFMYFFQPFGVSNNWKLLSYINVFVQTTLAMGVVFLLPIIVFFLAKIDLITTKFMKEYRKHAFVVILSIAAIITPADLLSMFIASIPLLLLYEFSIYIVHWVQKNKLPQKEVLKS